LNLRHGSHVSVLKYTLGAWLLDLVVDAIMRTLSY